MNLFEKFELYPFLDYSKFPLGTTYLVKHVDEFECSIINIFGRIVKEGNSGSNQISIGNLSNEYYVLQITQGNGCFFAVLLFIKEM